MDSRKALRSGAPGSPVPGPFMAGSSLQHPKEAVSSRPFSAGSFLATAEVVVPGTSPGGIVLDEVIPVSSSIAILSSVPYLPAGEGDLGLEKERDCSVLNLGKDDSSGFLQPKDAGVLSVSVPSPVSVSDDVKPHNSDSGPLWIESSKAAGPAASKFSGAGPMVAVSSSFSSEGQVIDEITPVSSSLPSLSSVLGSPVGVDDQSGSHPSSGFLSPVLSPACGLSAGPTDSSLAASGSPAVPERPFLPVLSNFESIDPSFPLLPKAHSAPAFPPCPGSPLPKSGLSSGDFVDKCKAQPSWASLVKEDPTRLQLKFLKPDSVADDGKLRIRLPTSVALKGAAVWRQTLVGFFLDRLPFSLVQSCAQRHWGLLGLSEVLSNGNGFYFFKFSEAARLNEVLEGGPWYFGGRPIFLKLWSPGMNLSKEGCKRVPIWAHFYNVPLEYWNEEGLSYIASTVGKPLHADSLTSSMKRLNYARICIEINIEDSLPNAFDIVLEDGSCMEILIEYNWVPKKCAVCSAFGHLTKNCKKVSRRVWVPKISNPPVLTSSSGDWMTVSDHGRDKLTKTSPASKVQHPIPPSVSSNGVISASGLSCSTNAFESLHVEDDAVVHSHGKEESVLSSPSSNALQLHPTKDPTTAVDDPFRSGVGVSSLVDDPIGGSGDPMVGHDPIGIVADDPIDVDDPSGTGAAEDPKFDDPNAFSTVTTVPLASSVSLVGDSSCSALSSPCIGCDDSSPSSSPSSTPLLARRLMLIDEVERKLGRKKKDKKKNGSSGNSRGKLSSISK